MKGLITKHRCNFYQRIMRLDSFWCVYAPRMRRSPPRTACHLNGVGAGVQVNLQVNLFKAIAGGAAPAAPRVLRRSKYIFPAAPAAPRVFSLTGTRSAHLDLRLRARKNTQNTFPGRHPREPTPISACAPAKTKRKSLGLPRLAE